MKNIKRIDDKRGGEGTAGQKAWQTYHNERRGVWGAMCRLVEPCALLFDVALVTVALQHGLANGPAAGAPTPHGVLVPCLGGMPALDWGWGRGKVWKGNQHS